MNQSILFISLSVLGVSFAISMILTPIVRKIALASGQVAIPRENRWHRKETALMGGIGIFLSMSIIWALAAVFFGWDTYGRPYFPMMLCAAAMFFLGLADDIFDIDPQHKLAGQIIIASVLMFFGLRLGWTESKTINLFLSIFWVVGITNAFNLLDNMDGLAAGIAFIGACFLFLWHCRNPQSIIQSRPLLLLCMAYMGAVSGFLIYNFNPASIFMGDAGSLFIGFVLACITMSGSPHHLKGASFVHLLSVIAIPIFILFIPILDTGFVSFMRKLFRRPVSRGGRDHSSHRMVAIGFSERKAVLVLYAFAVSSGLTALSIHYVSIWVSLVWVVLYLLLVLFFWIFLARVKVYPEKSILSEESSGRLTPILIEITYRRRIFEVLLDSVLITVAYYSAYILRFEGAIGENFPLFYKSLPIIIACQILCFYIMGVYRGVWESAGIRELSSYFKAITAGTLLSILIILFIYRFQSFSRAVFVIYWVIMLILTSFSRLSFRLLDEGVKKRYRKGKPTLVYGAGVGGIMAAREIESNRDLGLFLIGFIDDNPRFYHRKIHGYPVFGGKENLKQIIRKYDIEKIIISFKEKNYEKKKEIKSSYIEPGTEVEIQTMKLVIN